MILNDPKASTWFDNSGRLALAKKIYKEILQPNLDKVPPKEQNEPQASEVEKERVKAERRALREAEDLAKKHFQEGQGLQTQLANKGHRNVDLKNKDQVKNIVRHGLLKAHPDKGGDLEEAKFYALLKDLNDKDVLSDYDDKLKVLRR